MADISKRAGTSHDCDGNEGERGERGERGKRGKRGERGERGERGRRGPRGPRGRDGQDCNPANCREKGGLGWNHIRLTIQPLTTVSIDTGIGGDNIVPGEPPLGTIPPAFDQPPFSGPFTDPTGVVATTLLVPPPGTTPASRLMVIPLPPISNWTNITIPTEPFWNTATLTVWITLANTNELLPVEINILVWDPLRRCPGRADTYSSLDNPNPDSGPF